MVLGPVCYAILTASVASLDDMRLVGIAIVRSGDRVSDVLNHAKQHGYTGTFAAGEQAFAYRMMLQTSQRAAPNSQRLLGLLHLSLIATPDVWTDLVCRQTAK